MVNNNIRLDAYSPVAAKLSTSAMRDSSVVIVLTRALRRAEPGTPLKYQPACLRISRTAICSPLSSTVNWACLRNIGALSFKEGKTHEPSPCCNEVGELHELSLCGNEVRETHEPSPCGNEGGKTHEPASCSNEVGGTHEPSPCGNEVGKTHGPVSCNNEF